jgi:hypothetical protein
MSRFESSWSVAYTHYVHIQLHGMMYRYRGKLYNGYVCELNLGYFNSYIVKPTYQCVIDRAEERGLRRVQYK